MQFVIIFGMNTEDNLTLHEYQALAEFRYQLRRFLHFSEAAAHSAGLEPRQHQLLLALKGLPEGRKANITDIAERLQIKHHSAVELIDRLIARGFIVRNPDTSGHRRVLITLTPQGEEILHTLSHIHRTELRTLSPDLIQALNSLNNDSNKTTS
ncbi:MAG: helix-turn-helix domain-containing protein [Ktedonobacteraceae bacterium]